MPDTLDVIDAVADENLLWSVVESAVTVTTPLDGTLVGAVYIVGLPLAVWVGLKDPQLAGLPQVAIQSTPALAISSVTAAATWAVVPASMLVGGNCVTVREISGVVLAAFGLAELPPQAAIHSEKMAPVTIASRVLVY